MAWTTPRTWIPGEMVTDAMMNLHVRDQLAALFAGAKGITGQQPGDMFWATTSTQEGRIPGGTSGHVLTSAGPNAQPVWAAAAGGSGFTRAGVGPAASSPTAETSIQTVNILGNTVAVGDHFRVWALWIHSGTVTAPRVNLNFGGTTLAGVGAGAALDDVIVSEAWLTIMSTTPGSYSQVSFGRHQRPNGTFLGFGGRTTTVDTSAAQDFDFRANFNGATADTIRLGGYCVARFRST